MRFRVIALAVLALSGCGGDDHRAPCLPTIEATTVCYDAAEKRGPRTYPSSVVEQRIGKPVSPYFCERCGVCYYACPPDRD